MAISMGVDPSTKTGVVVLNHDGSILYAEEIKISPLLKGIERAEYIGDMVATIYRKFSPDVVVIEGYGFENRNTLATLVEIGTVIRLYLQMFGANVRLIAPNGLKKYVLSVGAGKKDQMRLGVFKNWGYENKSDNVVDAYSLAKVGHGVYEKDLPKYRSEVLAKLYDM